MEIKISIPKNSYSIPTEVREDVVQSICSHIVSLIDNVVVWNTSEKYFTGEYFTTMKYTHASGPKENIRIRGCEMNAVFDVLQKAGYFIYRVPMQNDLVKFFFYIKPQYKGIIAKKETFKDFID